MHVDTEILKHTEESLGPNHGKLYSHIRLDGTRLADFEKIHGLFLGTCK